MKEIKLEAVIERIYINGKRAEIVAEPICLIEGALMINQEKGEVPSSIKKIKRISSIVGCIRDNLDNVLIETKKEIDALVAEKTAAGEDLTKEEVEAINTLRKNRINEVFNTYNGVLRLEDSDAEFLYDRMIQTKYKYESDLIPEIVAQLKPE